VTDTARLAAVGLDRFLGRDGLPAEPLAAAAAAAGVTARHLRRAVRTLTGLTPKYLQRVDRLTQTLAEADQVERLKGVQFQDGVIGSGSKAVAWK